MLKRLLLTRNVAGWDRVLRVLPALIVLWAYMQGQIVGPTAIVLGVVSAMLLVTSITGTCSIYGALGLSTLRKRIDRRSAVGHCRRLMPPPKKIEPRGVSPLPLEVVKRSRT